MSVNICRFKDDVKKILLKTAMKIVKSVVVSKWLSLFSFGHCFANSHFTNFVLDD